MNSFFYRVAGNTCPRVFVCSLLLQILSELYSHVLLLILYNIYQNLLSIVSVQYQKEPKKITLIFFHTKKKFTPLALIKWLEGLETCNKKVKSVFKRLNMCRLLNNSNLSGHRLTVYTPALTKQMRGRIRQKHQLPINLVARQLRT
jgi:hypothetical protein